MHLRLFLEICRVESWLPISQPNIIFDDDIPKPNPCSPRFIHDNVLRQLINSLHTIPEHTQRLIRVLIETGRRIGEVCTLPYDCLYQDESNDYYLNVNDKKTHKKYLIPLSSECMLIIRKQQAYIEEIGERHKGYLFLGSKNCKVAHAKARTINMVLHNLAADNNIVNDNGELWRFSSHQFRHTAGTRMINAGVPQHIVQRYLGHESPEMTSRYAYIHDQTLKNEFKKLQGKLVDIQGKSITLDQIVKEDAKWLKHNISSQALPNGVCTLPCAQKRCPHANACLTCSNFKTSKEHLSSHKKQLKQTEKIIHTAKANGWQRQVEMNNEVKANLKRIINALEGK